MKLYLFENFLSEKYKTFNSKCKTFGDIVKTLKLKGNYIFLIENKKYNITTLADTRSRWKKIKDYFKKNKINYTSLDEKLPQTKLPILIKKVPRNATTQIIVGAVVSFIPGLQTIGYSMVAGGLISLFAPKVNTSSDTDAKSNYSLSGGANSLPSINDKYPIVFGKHKIVPPLLGSYFTSLSSNTGRGDQYINGLVCLGYNQLSIKDLKFGSNVISNNSADVRNGNIAITGDTFNGTVEIRQDGTLPSIYTTKMYEEQPGITITENETSDFKYMYASPAKTKSVRAFFSLAGLYYVEEDGRRPAGMIINMAIRAKGASSWSIIVPRTIQDQTKDPLRYYLEYNFSSAELAANPSGEWEVALYRSSSWRCWKDGTIRKSVTNTDSNLVMTTTWNAFQCVIDDVPVISSELSKLCLVAFRIKATESNTGSLDQFNCVAQRLMPAWDGVNSGSTGWTSSTANSNPASAFLLSLQGNQLPTPVANDRIDWSALETLYTWCNTNSYECNGIISSDETTRSVLDKILFTCRSYFYMKNGLYSFIHDNYIDTPICILSPELSSDFKASKNFAEKADAFEITYDNSSDDYESTSEQVYPYGKSSAVGDLVDKIDYWGVVSHAQVYKLARYQMAALKLRPETYELKVGVEHFGIPLGARVLLQHDVLSVGIDSGFIKSIDSETQITLRKEIPFNKIDTFGIVIYEADGTIVSKVCNFSEESLSAGYTDKIILSDTSGINPDDIFLYGKNGTEYIDCLVKSKTPEASPDLSATLILIEYNEAIYEATEQPVPDYNTKITKTSSYELKTIGTSGTDLYSENNGNSVQDDGAVYLTFEDATIDGATLINMGSYKTISNSTPNNLVRSTDSENRTWAVSNKTSLIPFKVDNIFYNNFSINFFVKDLDLTTDGYIFKYLDATYNNLIALRIASGKLILQVQVSDNEIPITISGSGNSSMLSFSINFENNLLVAYENNNLILSISIGEAYVIDDNGNQVVDDDGNDVVADIATTPSNNNRDIYFNLLSTDSTDGFIGAIRKFRIFGFALEASDVDSLYTNEYLLQNVIAAGRYLGELTSAPTLINTYDTFTYTGTTNVDFKNGLEYTWNGYKWIVWNL